MTRIAMAQMTSGIDPDRNRASLVNAIAQAKQGGAAMLFTPEMSGLLDQNRQRAAAHICYEGDDPVLSAVRNAAAREGMWVALGSLAIRRENIESVGHGDAAFANRSFVIDAGGDIVARYDKLHMFDVSLETGGSWRESAAYAPGDRIVTVQTPVGRLGLSICYDLRFPALFAALARSAPDVIAIPAAFTVPTGAAHWHVLQRARAIEASAYVVAAAQVGYHEDGRTTYGHSLLVDPWGSVALDMGGDSASLGFADIDPARITDVRRQIPSLANARELLP